MLAEQTLELQSAQQLYALNLFSASTPNALPKPTAWELERFPFFVTQTNEAGRIRFHLHMGLFENKEEATECLALVRATYPWAWVSLLPMELVDGRKAPVSLMGKEHPLFSKPSGSSDETEKESQEAAPAEQPLKRRKLHVSKILSVKRGEGSIVSIETAKYAVQLHWSVMPVSLDRVKTLELFDEYILYVAQCEFEGRKWHALRLGFFSKAQSAMAIAKYLRSEFYSAALIPVTQDEKLQVNRLCAEEADRTLNTQAVAVLLSNT